MNSIYTACLASYSMKRAVGVDALGVGLWEGEQGPQTVSTGTLFQLGSLVWDGLDFPRVSLLLQ